MWVSSQKLLILGDLRSFGQKQRHFQGNMRHLQFVITGFGGVITNEKKIPKKPISPSKIVSLHVLLCILTGNTLDQLDRMIS
ncbi:hypothetical protein AKJ29_17185 [Aliiroseovarius crassostreae]|uniref:Uncharacterized protein n=1 Tax=Aliiroseovarius crassostreae TaxID=154981 RepID=A0A0P7KPP9_9RHOB|nr:hypothetical protein AKJ29_17185 [Aliiroseovarius crassostreae]